MRTTSKKIVIINYFILVTLLSIPFWVLGAFVDISNLIPIQLPISALMFLCPMLAAIILTSGGGKKGDLKMLLNQVWDFNKIKNKWWLLVAILLIPVLLFLSYLLMVFLHYDLPKPEIKFSATIIFAFSFFIGSIGEEVGWTGFITQPLQKRLGAISAALVIGTIWAIWHIIPYLQTHRNATWIFWQCMGTVALRIIMVWLYNKTNKSLFAVIVCHTSINMAVNIFPNNGSHYDPYYFGLAVVSAAIIISYFGFARNEGLQIPMQAKLN